MDEIMVITRSADLDGAVGKLVSLRGTVENSRIATLLGVDIESESPDLRGQPAVASGRLERVVVTAAAIDDEIAQRGQFAHRGPGTYYRLLDPTTGRLVHVQPAAAGLPLGRFQLEEQSPSLTLELLPATRLRLTAHASVVEGAYAVTATKMADYHVSFAIDRGSARVLDTELRAGPAFRLTLHFDCVGGKNAVQLCLHDGPKPRCELLRDWTSSCTAPPAIDGAQINRRP